LVRFEDFEIETAFKLLDYFRWRCSCFNDDNKGTACIAAAARIKGVLSLREQKILFIGVGSAAIEIANLIVEMAASRGEIIVKECK
jgi:malate dehydrogenase (oxaloacetate-decarboxylating)/malate dehydrogenase (oxaloacetate-decarboxylating)(NADP+)